MRSQLCLPSPGIFSLSKNPRSIIYRLYAPPLIPMGKNYNTYSYQGPKRKEVSKE